ncbi:hypothetical protein K8R42_03150 [bacterium]|nr:hypothetical protein [bacterium]
MMNDMLECQMSVDRVTDAKGKDHVVTIVLKGSNNIIKGDHLEDVAEATLTLKFSQMSTAKRLGITEYMANKVIVLRDRDTSLSEFGEVATELQEAIA